VIDKQLLNQTEAAEFFGVSRRTIYDWRKRNFGPKFVPLPSGRKVTTRENCFRFLAELGNS
jgi:predicted DNA-binding transcriptional regulator AlpA